MRLGADITGRSLTTAEVVAFLARHPSTAGRVAWHNTTSTLYCHPVGEGTLIPGAYEWERETLGIPWRGLAVDDAALGGTVMIFSDADCNLRYSLLTGAAAPAIGEATNEPEPQPVPHAGNVWTDLVEFGQGALTIAALGFLLFASSAGRRK